MKKFVVSMILASFIMLMLGSTMAMAAVNIGYIEVARVFKEYKETAKSEEQVSKLEEDFKKDFDASQKQLSDAEKKGMKKEELDKLRKELEDKLSPKRQAYVDLNQKLVGKIQADIVSATKDVAKNVGIDVVIDKQAVITGGVDLTEMVINKLNEGK